MRAIVTGQVGMDKRPYLAGVQALAGEQGESIDIFHVGDLMYAEAPDVRPGRILDLPISRLHSLRRAAFKDIISQARESANLIVNTHATFRWRHGLFSAFDFDQMKAMEPNLFICLVDNIETVHHRLHADHVIDATLKDCMGLARGGDPRHRAARPVDPQLQVLHHEPRQAAGHAPHALPPHLPPGHAQGLPELPHEPRVNHADVLRGDVLGGTIAQETKLDITLDKANKWAESPLSIDSIYDDTILPFYRVTKNPTSLRNAWESRISQLTTLAGTAEKIRISTRAKGGLLGGESRGGRRAPKRQEVREQRKEKADDAAERLADFRREELPDLQWEMERDSFVFGSNKAASARKLGSHIRDHLDHKSATGWIAEMKKLAAGDFEVEDYLGIDKEETDETPKSTTAKVP